MTWGQAYIFNKLPENQIDPITKKLISMNILPNICYEQKNGNFDLIMFVDLDRNVHLFIKSRHLLETERSFAYQYLDRQISQANHQARFTPEMGLCITVKGANTMFDNLFVNFDIFGGQTTSTTYEAPVRSLDLIAAETMALLVSLAPCLGFSDDMLTRINQILHESASLTEDLGERVFRSESQMLLEGSKLKRPLEEEKPTPADKMDLEQTSASDEKSSEEINPEKRMRF